MWSVWMFAVPSLRARSATPRRRTRSTFCSSPSRSSASSSRGVEELRGGVHADCLLMAYMYYNKGAGIFDDGSEKAAEEPTAW